MNILYYLSFMRQRQIDKHKMNRETITPAGDKEFIIFKPCFNPSGSPSGVWRRPTRIETLCEGNNVFIIIIITSLYHVYYHSNNMYITIATITLLRNICK